MSGDEAKRRRTEMIESNKTRLFAIECYGWIEGDRSHVRYFIELHPGAALSAAAAAIVQESAERVPEEISKAIALVVAGAEKPEAKPA